MSKADSDTTESIDDRMNPVPTDSDIRKELNTILPGKDALSGLHAKHQGGLDYQVLSVRDGAPSIHWVTLGETPTCTCSDFKGNRKTTFTEDFGDREPCAHICSAYLADRLDPQALAVQELINAGARLSEATQRAHDASMTMEDAAVKTRDAQAGAVASASQTSENTSQSSSSPQGMSPEDAAETLQSAYDDLIPDMQVEYTDGYVWVQTGRDTPESLPGPGSVSVFDALLKDAEQMQFVPADSNSRDMPDGYRKAPDEQPGQWWKNAILPDDVESYINEVLN